MASALFQNGDLKSLDPKVNQEAIKSCSQRQASDRGQLCKQLLDWVDQCEYNCREPKCKFKHKHRQTFVYHLKTRHGLTPDTFIDAWNGLAATEKMHKCKVRIFDCGDMVYFTPVPLHFVTDVRNCGPSLDNQPGKPLQCQHSAPWCHTHGLLQGEHFAEKILLVLA